MHPLLWIGLFASVFAATFLIEVLDAANIRSVTERRPWMATLSSTGMYLLGTFGFIAFFKVTEWSLVPELLGLACGAHVSARRRR